MIGACIGSWVREVRPSLPQPVSRGNLLSNPFRRSAPVAVRVAALAAMGLVLAVLPVGLAVLAAERALSFDRARAAAVWAEHRSLLPIALTLARPRDGRNLSGFGARAVVEG